MFDLIIYSKNKKKIKSELRYLTGLKGPSQIYKKYDLARAIWGEKNV